MPSVRDVFFSRIYNQVKSGENIYIVTADLGAPSLDQFRLDYPGRYISVGIAEQNLIQVAAGMTLGGCKVVAYGLNPFPVTRAFDQVRCLLAELKIPLTLCVLNSGLCSAECGYTHMPIEDMTMLRTLSNIDIFNPSDETISAQLASETSSILRPRIIRFDKSISGTIYNNVNFDVGFEVQGAKGEAKVGVVTYGCYARELSTFCKKNENNFKLLDLYKIPFDKNSLIGQLSKCDKIISIEENILNGGLGGLLLELFSDYGINKTVIRYGLNFSNGYYDVFTDRNYIRKDQLIDINSLTNVISECLA